MDSNGDGSWGHVGLEPGDQPSDNVPPAAATAEMHRAMTATDVASACSRVVDLKQLRAPPVFDGNEQHWQEWKYRMENLFVLTGVSKACTWALTAEKLEIELAVMPKEFEGIAIFLHAVLAQVCTGKALALVRLQLDHNGLLAWRRLVTDTSPSRLSDGPQCSRH
jgi:hypothetical protein